jgi:hypothetical protein
MRGYGSRYSHSLFFSRAPRSVEQRHSMRNAEERPATVVAMESRASRKTEQSSCNMQRMPRPAVRRNFYLRRWVRSFATVLRR